MRNDAIIKLLLLFKNRENEKGGRLSLEETGVTRLVLGYFFRDISHQYLKELKLNYQGIKYAAKWII
jgi:hypothetical protein